MLKEATEIRHQGLDLQKLQGNFTSSPQTSEHVNRGAVGKSLVCKVCNLKVNTLTWIQDAKLVKRKSLVHMIDMQAQKTHQVGNLNTSDISLFAHWLQKVHKPQEGTPPLYHWHCNEF